MSWRIQGGAKPFASKKRGKITLAENNPHYKLFQCYCRRVYLWSPLLEGTVYAGGRDRLQSSFPGISCTRPHRQRGLQENLR